jgi:hypothetical protein
MLRRLRWLLLIVGLPAAAAVVYVRANPLVFNESFWNHAHCIKAAGLELMNYAEKNGGKFPSHPKGYANALLLLNEDCYFAFSGPGYDEAAFYQAKTSGRDLPEEECGRVYIQGLSQKSDPEIALLFDKRPTPGGDHCHFIDRMMARLGREVWFVGCHSTFVTEDEWPEFTKHQVELLVKEGYPREEVQRLFDSKPKQ